MNSHDKLEKAEKVPSAYGIPTQPTLRPSGSCSDADVFEYNNIDVESDFNNALSESTETYATKLRKVPELEAAIFSEPLMTFSDEDRLDIIDGLGNELYKLPDATEMPKFTSTVRRETYIIIQADNEYSRDWLFAVIPTLNLLSNRKLFCMPAKELPKMKKGLLWLPGKQKLENAEILSRLKRHNDNINPLSWRVFSRHEEKHGLRLMIGVSEDDETTLSKYDNRIQWSVSRAIYTPLSMVIERRKKFKKDVKVTKEKELYTDLLPKNIGNIHKPKSSEEVSNLPITSQTENEKISNFLKRKGDLSQSNEDSPLISSKDKVIDDTSENTSFSPFLPSKNLMRSPSSTKNEKILKRKKIDKHGDKMASGNIMKFLSSNMKQSVSAPNLCDNGSLDKETKKGIGNPISPDTIKTRRGSQHEIQKKLKFFSVIYNTPFVQQH